MAQSNDVPTGKAGRIQVLAKGSWAAPGHCNEDRVGYFAGDQYFYAWMIDGATSPTDERFISKTLTDGAWYAGRLDIALRRASREEPSVNEIAKRAITCVCADFEAARGERDIPMWAWPLAALSLISLKRTFDGWQIEGLHLADCPVYLAANVSNTVIWEKKPLGEIRVAGSDDQASMDAIQRLKRRRIEQHQSRTTPIAGLSPDSAQYAVLTSSRITEDLAVVLMSDGLSRSFDEYQMISRADALLACQDYSSSEELLNRMRKFEEEEYSRKDGRMFKTSDDASFLALKLISN